MGTRGSARGAHASSGASLERVPYALGSDDVFVIALPDHASAAAVALTVGASGVFEGETTVLLTPEETDGDAARTPRYRPPKRRRARRGRARPRGRTVWGGVRAPE